MTLTGLPVKRGASTARSVLAGPVLAVCLGFALVGCGGESGEAEDAAASTTAEPTPSEEPSETFNPDDIPTYDPNSQSPTPALSGGPCDDLAYIAVNLRGEEPERVIQKGPTEVNFSGLPFVGGGCDFAYAGHEAVVAPHAITVYVYEVDHAELTKEELAFIYDDENAVPVDGLGVPAQYIRNVDGKYSDASAEAVVGNSLVQVHVSLPEGMDEGVPYLEQEPMVAALKEWMSVA